MEHFPPGIQFKYPWRKYQKRILDELTEHLGDDHLHLVAPPGSGKTVLGLEVALRLNKPTLIIAPTLAIRNQWILRFCELFLSTHEKPAWISRNIHQPKFLTVITYQALHVACREEATQKDRDTATASIIEKLKIAGIKTIVVDEAHHLQNAWWQSLNEVKQALKPTIVGLTATPPYDVSRAEWQRYIALNGPVDAEITVPELVVEGDLCPHQDFVVASKPTERENQKILRHQQRITSLFNEIRQDALLIDALKQHHFFSAPLENLDEIYSSVAFYASILIFLNQAGVDISREHLEVIGDKKLNVPELNTQWMETLLSFCLYKVRDQFASFEAHMEKLQQKLTLGGVIENRSINFANSQKISRLLSSSITKLDSILDIASFEYKQLHTRLRMVILTDYIRREYYVDQPENTRDLNKIGVMPIFEQLRRHAEKEIKLGVLTGSLVIIPVSAQATLHRLAARLNTGEISTAPLAYDQDYLVVSATEKNKHDLVHIVTEIFQRGDIEILTGTKALLGEGWDAPAINSLILASFVGSYVQSNQMRGRAIRTSKTDADKTSNIWHLICVDPCAIDGGEDMQRLKRRFKAFVGVSLDGDESIENGLHRLRMPRHLEADIVQYNRKVFDCAGQREQLRQRWHTALAKGLSLVEEYKIPFPVNENYRRNKRMSYNKTIAYLFATAISGLAAFAWTFAEWLARNFRLIRNLDDLLILVGTAGAIALFLFGTQLVDAARLSLKYRDISKDVKKIGQALLATLQDMGVINTDSSDVSVVAEVDNNGSIYSFLDGGTTYERSIFIKSLQEIISAIDNPRYIVVRKSLLLKLIFQRDYHSVPEIIGCKKAFAERFKAHWEHRVGRCALIYTRTLEGRKFLLRSRLHSLAAEFQDKSERINKWR